MGVPEANTTLIYGVHVRESANDGSDFTNAAADYRILFLGEDGLLHVKDSSGTVTSPYSSSGGTPVFNGARVFHNADQSLTAGVDTALAFNSERYDTNTYHDTSTNNSRLTVPTTGYYHMSGTVSFTASATAWSGLWIRLGGSTKIAQTRGHIEDGSNVMSLTVDTDYQITAGGSGYVELMAFSSAGTRSALVLGNYSCEFAIHLIGT